MQGYKDYTKIEKAKYEAKGKLRESTKTEKIAEILYNELIQAYWWGAKNSLDVMVDKAAFVEEIRRECGSPPFEEIRGMTYEEYANHWLAANGSLLPFREYITPDVRQYMEKKYSVIAQVSAYLPVGYNCYVRYLWRREKK